MHRLPLLILVCALGCDKKAPTKVEGRPIKIEAAAATDEATWQTRSSLKVAPQAGAFVVSDGAGRFTLTLPQEPRLTGERVSEGGVTAWNAQAIMPGTEVDVQFGVVSMRDGDMPASMLAELADAPTQLAAATGGAVAKNATETLAGAPARVFEITVPDGRRLFGWHVTSPAHGRMYQLNCVGPDGAPARTACAAVAASLTLAP
ncbi:MAG: hypothetical protein IPL61_24685 [Myxococcales bacterium]|nr:hypothetical protein [Myxococcales bacterium]